MMPFRRKRESEIDPDTVTQQALTSLAKTREQQPKVNALTSWLNTRHNQNGFGDDFEYTLRPKEA